MAGISGWGSAQGTMGFGVAGMGPALAQVFGERMGHAGGAVAGQGRESQMGGEMGWMGHAGGAFAGQGRESQNAGGAVAGQARGSEMGGEIPVQTEITIVSTGNAGNARGTVDAEQGA